MKYYGRLKVRRERDKMLRYLKLRFHIWRIMRTNKELLERLNDYDENGCPYWKKTGTVDPG